MTPTPETIARWRLLTVGNNSLGADALKEAADACEALIAERDYANQEAAAFFADAKELIAERDQALARVAECELANAVRP